MEVKLILAINNHISVSGLNDMKRQRHCVSSLTTLRFHQMWLSWATLRAGGACKQEIIR